MEDAVALEQVAAHIDALVAGDAAERLEKLVAGKLLRRDRVGIPGKPAVESGARRDQRPQVGRDRVQEGGHVGRAPVGVAELPGASRSARNLLTTSSALDAMVAGLRSVCSTSRAQARGISLPVQAKVQG